MKKTVREFVCGCGVATLICIALAAFSFVPTCSTLADNPAPIPAPRTIPAPVPTLPGGSFCRQ